MRATPLQASLRPSFKKLNSAAQRWLWILTQLFFMPYSLHLKNSVEQSSLLSQHPTELCSSYPTSKQGWRGKVTDSMTVCQGALLQPIEDQRLQLCSLVQRGPVLLPTVTVGTGAASRGRDCCCCHCG